MRIHPDLDFSSLRVSAVAPVHLPMAGGTSEAKASKVLIHGKKVKFGDVDRKLLGQLKKKKLFTIASGYSLAATGPHVEGKPFTSKTVSEIKGARGGDEDQFSGRWFASIWVKSSHVP